MVRTGEHNRLRPALTALVIGGCAMSAFYVAGLDEARGQQGAHATSFAGPPTFADVVEQVSPSVVTVSVMVEPVVVRTSSGASPFQGTPFEDFFGGFGMPNQPALPLPQPRRGEGSGFIIDEAGYIATNNHVVDGASRVMVTLASGEQLEASVVGSDPLTDLALIKVDNGRALPALTLGDSDRARIGDWVLAIGNPFGLGGTATAGIISARGRELQEGRRYDDFLQIDAAINSGNSGGPVFNAAGEVIGINTAIYSPSGGSVGIGFAIPSNQARDVLDELRQDGRVDRGWLGIRMQVDDPAGADVDGVVVEAVTAGGPAEAAGIEPGDVITSFNGQPVDSSRTLRLLVGALNANDRVEVEVRRDGGRQVLMAELGQFDEAALQAAAPVAPESRPERFREMPEQYRSYPQAPQFFFRR